MEDVLCKLCAAAGICIIRPSPGAAKGFEQFAGLYDNGGPAPDTVVVEGEGFLAAAGALMIGSCSPVSDYRFLGEGLFWYHRF